MAGLPTTGTRKFLENFMQERCSRNNEEPTTTFLKVPIYRIVSIATLNANREDGGGPWTVSQIGSRSVGEKTEAARLRQSPSCG